MRAQAGVPAVTGPILGRRYLALGPGRTLPSPPMWLLAGGFALLAVGVAALLVAPDAHPRPSAEEPGPSALASESFFNRRARYSFRYPSQWLVEPSRTATRVSSPRRDAVISFGLGAPGTLDHAEATLVTEVQKAYQDTRVAAVQAQRIGARPALSVSGSGVNPQGVAVRFLAITVKGQSRNYSITVFTAADAGTSVLPRIQEIVSSFRAT